MKRIAIVSDAERSSQTSGVVTTLRKTKEEAELLGHEVCIIEAKPGSLKFSLPFYHEVKLQLIVKKYVQQRLKDFDPDYIHIATEGTLGLAARAFCLDPNKPKPFTTAFHTECAAFISTNVQRSAKWMGFSELKCDQFANSAAETTWRYLRWFHAPSSAVMVATLSLEKTLEAKGFRNIVSWSRGVDTDQFQPYGKDFSPYAELPRPVLVYMGRVAPEKNIDAFLSLDLPGSKVVVGDGPVLNELRARFPNALFVGKKEGEELGRHVAAGDIFVFPSMADTFGLVVLEALACGVPVAAYPVTGPIDILKDKACGSFSCLNGNLKEAVLQLLAMREVGQIDAVAARRYVSENYSWKTATEQFCNNLQDNTEVAQRKTKRLGRVAAAINPWRLLRPRNGG